MIIRKEGIGITETSRKKDIIDPVEDCVVHQFDTRILDSGSRMLKILDLCNYRDILWNSTDPVSEGALAGETYSTLEGYRWIRGPELLRKMDAPKQHRQLSFDPRSRQNAGLQARIESCLKICIRGE